MHIGIGMIPSEIVPKGNQYEMFNSLLEWIRRFKAKISREFNRFRNDCILVTQILGSSSVLINHNMFLLKRFGFLQCISLNMVLQVNSWILAR